MLPWSVAWQDALYGPSGFYRRPEGPAGHFVTASHGGFADVLANAVTGLADSSGLRRLVDVGCGRGELLAAVHQARPDLALTGVDIVTRPVDLPSAIAWIESPGGAALPPDLADLDGVLVLAHEWLDVVPCPVAEVAPDFSLREVLVDPTDGCESLGPPLAGPDRAWAARWWPTAGMPCGSRVEVGRPRDEAWADLLSRVRSGLAVAVDYGHTKGDRPRGGTLTAYQGGVQVDPVPDGTCDLTAHVSVDSLAHDEIRTQRDVLADLATYPPPHGLARADPAAYLAAVSRRSSVAALRDAGGLGAFRWVFARVG